MFENREEAGRKLAEQLPDLDPETTIVLALPRGGVPVAAQICKARGLPLDLVFVRKIGAPGHEELAIGAVVNGDDPQVVVNDELAQAHGLDREEVERRGREKLPEIAERRKKYLAGRSPMKLAGRTVVVVDDGVATGATLRAALAAVRRAAPERVILALPVAPADTLDAMRDDVDEVICLQTPMPFYAVGAHYRDFPQTTDDEVRELVETYAPAPE